MNLLDRIRDHKEELVKAAEESPFIVFLCGPTLDTENPEPSAALRASLTERLVAEGFEVVLGEDDGLEEARLDLGINAQDNELEFIRRHCNAVIVIADSVGAFCELGLLVGILFMRTVSSKTVLQILISLFFSIKNLRRPGAI